MSVGFGVMKMGWKRPLAVSFSEMKWGGNGCYPLVLARLDGVGTAVVRWFWRDEMGWKRPLSVSFGEMRWGGNGR
ncbi:MAG: hypothetical protein R6X34_22945 [Chloroflexota bacterium]